MRLYLRLTALLALPLLLAAPVFGQRAATTRATQIDPEGNVYLRFSRDGTLLRIIGLSPGDTVQKQHVRAVTYSARTGAVLHVFNLELDTAVLSVTSDGATAIVSTGTSSKHPHLILLNTATGQRQPIPDAWSPDAEVNAAISGDGHLVSTYFETQSDTPMTVTVYDWATKSLIATRKSAYVSAGGFMDGNITEDSEVEFEGNRVGSTIVDLKTGRVMAKFGQSSVRSPDGRWQIEFPNLNWNEAAPKEVLLKDGATGETIGKLDYTPADNEMNGSLTGAFCGASGRFLLYGGASIAAYALPSGKLLEGIPAAAWRDPDQAGFPAVACSPDGKQAAILDGARLTFHHLK